MARYNEILVGRMNRGLQKFLGMKGEPPAPQLSSEISAQFEIPTGIEERYLHGFDIFGADAITNTAAQTSAQRLRNPPGSGAIAVITSLVLSAGAAMQVAVSTAISTVDETGTTSSGRQLDSRGRPNSSCIYSTSQGVAPASSAGTQGFWVAPAMPAGTPFQVIQTHNQEIPILPGQLILINSSVAATNLGVGIVWRERYLEESEKF